MKKLLLLFAIGTFTFTNAQISFSHAAGAKIFLATNSDLDYISTGLIYSPRLNVVEVGDNATVSIGTHIGLAFEAEYNSRDEGGGSTSFIYDLPIVAEYNFGTASNRDNDESFGFYLGAGYAIHNSSDFNEAISGPVVNGGLRFLIVNKVLDVNLSYLIASKDITKLDYFSGVPEVTTTSVNQSIFGVGVQYTFGF